MLGVRIVAWTGVVGVITVQRDEVRPFSMREIEVVTAFATQGAIAIENVRLVARRLGEGVDGPALPYAAACACDRYGASQECAAPTERRNQR
jgi:GAF domain-containing protein